MTGLSLGKTATQADAELVTTMFEALGKIHVVDEKLLNAVTGLRYFKLFIKLQSVLHKIPVLCG